ncbi:MAG: hypothetical protein QNJ44_19700 [Rhodobacter sp.]|nr:hypothetical protein [Rhodobacter sp.]
MFLVGCAEPETVPPAPGVVPDSGGLQPVGSPLRIDFWRAEAGVIAAVSRLTGARPDDRRRVPGCGDVVEWPDGLRLVFVGGDFRGWAFQARTEGVNCAV